MTDISVSNLIKSFQIGDNVLSGLSFDVHSGEHVGILGRNGAGKTTLFRILTGQMDYDEGEIFIAPGKKIGLISQIPVYPFGYTVEDVLRCAFSELSAASRRLAAIEKEMERSHSTELLREYDRLTDFYVSRGGYDMDFETDIVCNGLGIPAEMRERFFDSLSGGEKTRVNLGRLILEKTDILLLDEPTNHLDMHAVEWLEEYISAYKGTVLTVSHDRWFLDRTVTRIIEIEDGKAEFYSGNYSFYVEEKQARFQLQLKQYEQEQAKLGQLGFTLERMKGWGINNRTLYRRAMSIQHRMDRIRRTEKPKTEKTMHASFSEIEFHGDEVFSVKNLSKAYEGRTLFRDVSLLVKGGERIALLGDNGTGKTTFLKALLGEEPCEGRIRFGPTVKWAYLPQNISFAHPERTLYDTMLYEKNCTPQTARDRLGRYMFQGEDVFKTVSSLSGGEQTRLKLCMLMDEKINLLILDEPTNHLDVSSREWVEAAIEEYDGALLFVSHDRYFIREFAERIWVLENGVLKDHPYGYEKYRAVLEMNARAAKGTSTQADSPNASAAAVRSDKKPAPESSGGGTKELSRQLRKVEREIEKLEKENELLTSDIEGAGSDYVRLGELMNTKSENDEKLEALMTEWEVLSEQLENTAGNA